VIQPRLLTDREELAARLTRDADVHLYELGDLDPFFFPACRYWAHPSEPVTVLLYEGADTPTLLALEREPSAALAELVLCLADRLPGEVYAHLAVGLAGELTGRFRVERHGVHDKMALARDAAVGLDARGCRRLGPADRPQVEAFYRVAYPGSWFVPRMLETGAYVGIRESDDPAAPWVAVAGVHVVSAACGVAALGNVATSPEHRGKGLARRACAGVLRALDPRVARVGLNVAADNAAAIACYRGLGFARACSYEEVTLTRS
jgi:ribosomal protein S18 acetylase RimI-like enzyme